MKMCGGYHFTGITHCEVCFNCSMGKNGFVYTVLLVGLYVRCFLQVSPVQWIVMCWVLLFQRVTDLFIYLKLNSDVNILEKKFKIKKAILWRPPGQKSASCVWPNCTLHL